MSNNKWEYVKAAEKLEWRAFVDDDGSIEFERFSPAGEDFLFYIEGKDIAGEVKEYYESFDPDEHAEMWVNSRGKRGVPSSIRALIDDADAIDEMILELSVAFCELSNRLENDEDDK